MNDFSINKNIFTCVFGIILLCATVLCNALDKNEEVTDSPLITEFITELRLEIEQLKQGRQKAMIETLEMKFIDHETRLQNQEQLAIIEQDDGNTYVTSSQLENFPVSYLQPSFACDLEVITLSCSGNKTILVESAYYGQYLQTCTEPCCPPNPLDCLESMEENAPGDWSLLKSSCDGQQSCEFQHPGRDVLSCDVPYASNYVLVYYTCLPEEETLMSAFSATANVSRDYEENDIVIFDVIISNVGHHYLPETSTYLCPADGVYIFSLTVANDVDHNMYGEIMQEGIGLASAFTYNPAKDMYYQGATTVVTECSRGERVWVRCMNPHMNNERMIGYPWVIFTGALLNAF